MKNLIRCTLLILVSLSLVMCNKNNGDRDKNGITNTEIKELFKQGIKYYKCESDTAFGKDMEVYSQASVSIQWLEKIGDRDLSQLHDSLMARTFVKSKSDIDSNMITFMSRPIGYGDMKLTQVDSLPPVNDKIKVLSTSVEANIIGFTTNLIVYQITQNTFSGGDHPNYASTFLNYDLKNNKILDYDDIFVENSDSLILDVIKGALCNQFYAKDLDELSTNSGIFVNDIHITKNVYFNDGDIVFYYNPFEIGPWSIGAVKVSIPLYTFDPCLTDAIREIMPTQNI